MLLSTDYYTPAELTGYIRESLADYERNQLRLSEYLPSESIDDLEFRFSRGGEGLTEAATFRAYDAESPIGSRPGISRVTGELPALSRKLRLGEYDRLRQRRADQSIRDAILNDADRLARGIAARIELARGQAMVTGKVTIAENGVAAEADFGRDAGMSVAPATLWTDAANATPLTNLMTWKEAYIALNGSEPGAILTSNRVLALMMRNAEMRNLVFPGANQPSTVTQTAVTQALAAYGLPPISLYDAQVRVNGSSTRVIADDKLFLLPAPSSVDGGQLGKTLWGTTAESLESDFGLAGEEAGIVAGSYSTKDPVAVWTKAAAIALPVLANPNLCMVADVA